MCSVNYGSCRRHGRTPRTRLKSWMALRCAQIPLNAAMHIDPTKLDMGAGSSLAGQEGLNDENISHTRFLRPFKGR